ncbi:hypothetical protein Ptc2401_00277 [Prosthecochloris sp. CIB 2401]|nr:hypothetical protein Ptc2401_00277 [Prosthecochloris sp. CIB 2401]
MLFIEDRIRRAGQRNDSVGGGLTEQTGNYL